MKDKPVLSPYAICFKLIFEDDTEHVRTEMSKLFHSPELSRNREVYEWINRTLGKYIATSHTLHLLYKALYPKVSSGVRSAAEAACLDDRLRLEAAGQKMPETFFEAGYETRNGIFRVKASAHIYR